MFAPERQLHVLQEILGCYKLLKWDLLPCARTKAALWCCPSCPSKCPCLSLQETYKSTIRFKKHMIQETTIQLERHPFQETTTQFKVTIQTKQFNDKIRRNQHTLKWNNCKILNKGGREVERFFRALLEIRFARRTEPPLWFRACKFEQGKQANTT
jgi:hypothetical protein